MSKVKGEIDNWLLAWGGGGVFVKRREKMMILCCSERSERAIRHAGDIDLIVLDLKKRYHSYRVDSGHHKV